MSEDDSGVQQRITEFWDMVASGYDTSDNVAAMGSTGYTHWMEAVRAVLPTRPVRVLDVGTGTGFAAGIAAELGHDVIGIDTSAQMVARAQRNSPAVRFLEGDAVEPPVSRGSVEVVLSRSVVWTLRELDTAFASWFDLLAPGGRVVAIYGLIDPDTSNNGPGGVAEEAGTDQPAGEDDDVFSRYYTPATQAALEGMRLDSHERLVTAAHAAGFVEIEIVRLTVVHGWETSPGSQQPYALIGHRPPLNS